MGFRLVTACICCTLMVIAGPGPARAEEKPVVHEMEQVVVTATRTAKDIADAPGSVAVVTRADLEKRHIESLDQALNTVAGVYQKSGKGFMDTMAGMSLRGIPDDKRILFLLDGSIGLNDSYSGGASYLSVPMGDVERIEVVKGPFSSLYGGYAMGGVVNVITRMPQKREAVVKAGYGSSWDRNEGFDDLEKYYVSCGDRYDNRLSLLASYGYRATNGYPATLNVQTNKPTAGITGYTQTTDTKGAARYLIGDTGDNKWRDDQVSFKGSYDFTDVSNLTLSFIRSTYDYSYDDPHTCLKNAAGAPVWTYGTVRESSFLTGAGGREHNIYGVAFKTMFSDVEAKLTAGYSDRTSGWNVTRGTTAATTRTGGPGKLSDTPNSAFSTDVQFTLPVWHSHTLTLGTAFRQDRSDSEEHNLTIWSDPTTTTDLVYQASGKARSLALFLQDEIQLRDNLTAYLGFRQDWWETFDGYIYDAGKAGYPKAYDKKDADSLSPKAALVYKPFSLTALRTSIGQAFRPPTVLDLYRTFTVGATTFGANPDLQPETTTSWDAGIEQGLWKGMTVKATYFENEMKDLIYRKTVTTTYREAVNAGRAESKGVEVEVEQRFDKWLRLFANFTYTDARIKENDTKPSTVGKRMTQLPEKTANLGADLQLGPFSASLTGRYVGKRYADDDNLDWVDGVYTSYDRVFTADAKIGCKLAKWAEASFAVDNLFDKQYFAYDPAPGRSWFAELTLRY